MANVKVSGQTHKHARTQTDPHRTKTICPHDLRSGGIKRRHSAFDLKALPRPSLKVSKAVKIQPFKQEITLL